MSGQNDDKIKKKVIPLPNNIVMDIYGVITSWTFVEQLKTYIRNNLKQYLEKHFKDKPIGHIVNKLREQSSIEKSSGVEIPLIEEADKSQDIIINSIVTNILWQMDNHHKSCQTQLNVLYNDMWTDGYKTNRLKVHVFKDVKQALDDWRFHKFVKIYTYASGATAGQKLFMSSTVEGDLSRFIANYINSSGDYKYDSKKFEILIKALRESNPKNLLYFTDNPQKARAAIKSGMRALVVLRPANTQYSEEDLKDLITIQSFEELEFEEDPANPVPCC